MNHISFTVSGKHYKLAKLSVAILDQFLLWAKEHLPNPFANLLQAIDSKLPKEYCDVLFNEAKANSAIRGTINDPDVQALMNTHLGGFKLFQLRVTPEISLEQAGELMLGAAEEYGAEQWASMMERANSLGGKMAVSEEQAEKSFLS